VAVVSAVVAVVAAAAAAAAVVVVVVVVAAVAAAAAAVAVVVREEFLWLRQGYVSGTCRKRKVLRWKLLPEETDKHTTERKYLASVILKYGLFRSMSCCC
jgi:hypothetical protein